MEREKLEATLAASSDTKHTPPSPTAQAKQSAMTPACTMPRKGEATLSLERTSCRPAQSCASGVSSPQPAPATFLVRDEDKVWSRFTLLMCVSVGGENEEEAEEILRGNFLVDGEVHRTTVVEMAEVCLKTPPIAPLALRTHVSRLIEVLRRYIINHQWQTPHPASTGGRSGGGGGNGGGGFRGGGQGDRGSGGNRRSGSDKYGRKGVVNIEIVIVGNSRSSGSFKKGSSRSRKRSAGSESEANRLDEEDFPSLAMLRQVLPPATIYFERGSDGRVERFATGTICCC